jgi:hypothetical protein
LTDVGERDRIMRPVLLAAAAAASLLTPAAGAGAADTGGAALPITRPCPAGVPCPPPRMRLLRQLDVRGGRTVRITASAQITETPPATVEIGLGVGVDGRVAVTTVRLRGRGRVTAQPTTMHLAPGRHVITLYVSAMGNTNSVSATRERLLVE